MLETTNAREQIQALLAVIEAALPHLDTLADAARKATAAQSQLDGVLREYEGAVKRLEVARAELAKTESDLKAKRHLIHDESARSLATVNRQIAARQAELAALKESRKD
jgi:hypothetical protein